MFKSKVVPRGTDEARVIKVIQTVSLKGAGTEKNPVRYIYQYWDFKGKLLAEHDTYQSEATNSSASSEINS